MVTNFEIKTEALKSGVLLWEIADAMGIYDSAFSRILRKELSPEMKTEVLKIIAQIKAGRKS